MTKAQLWTRDFILVAAVNFLLVLIFYLLVVVVGLYAIRELQASISESGLVVGAFVVGILAGRLSMGQFIDRFGRKRSMLVGLFLANISCLFYFVEAGIGFLIAVRFLHGVAVGVAATSAATAVVQMIPMSRRGEGIGYFSMSSSLATAIGPFIGIYMMQHAGFDAIIGLCVVLGCVCFVAALLPNISEPKFTLQLHGGAAYRPQGFSLGRLVESKVVPICCVLFFNGLCFSGVLSYLNAFSVERHLNEAASFFFIVYAITVLASRPFSGRLMDRYGANVIMYPGFVLFALGLALMGLTESAVVLLLSACLIGLGFGNMQSCGQAIAVKLVDPSRLSLATSTYFIFVDAGLGFGPYLLGVAIGFTGYGALYIALGALCLLCMIAYYFVHGRHDKKMQLSSFTPQS